MQYHMLSRSQREQVIQPRSLLSNRLRFPPGLRLGARMVTRKDVVLTIDRLGHTTN